MVGSSDVVELHSRRGFKKTGPHAATFAFAAKHDLVAAAINGPSGLFNMHHAVVVGDFVPAGAE